MNYWRSNWGTTAAVIVDNMYGSYLHQPEAQKHAKMTSLNNFNSPERISYENHARHRGNELQENAPKRLLSSGTFWEISVHDGLAIKRTMKNLNTPSQKPRTDIHLARRRRTVGRLINHSGPNSWLDNGRPNESHGRLSTSAIYLRPPKCQWTQRSESHDNLSRTEHKASATDNWSAATEITNGTKQLDDNLGIKNNERLASQIRPPPSHTKGACSEATLPTREYRFWKIPQHTSSHKGLIEIG